VLDPACRAEDAPLPPASREITISALPAPQPSAVCVWDVKVCLSLVISTATAVSLVAVGAHQEPGGVVAMAAMAGFAARSTVRYLRILVR